MKPTPPRGFVVLTNAYSVDDKGNPMYHVVRASTVAAVSIRDGLKVTVSTRCGWVADVNESYDQVVDAMNAANAVEQNGVAASFVASVVEQMLKQQKAT